MDDSRVPAEEAHPGPSSSVPTALTLSLPEGGDNATAQLPLRPGHEHASVALSSYPKPNRFSRTMSERTPSALDREQMQGLVSIPLDHPETAA
jgi:hypothetical protein